MRKQLFIFCSVRLKRFSQSILFNVIFTIVFVGVRRAFFLLLFLCVCFCTMFFAQRPQPANTATRRLIKKCGTNILPNNKWPHPKDGEGNVFSLCVSPHLGGGGVLPHLHPIIFPLVPCPFWGVTPSPPHNTSTGSMSLLGGIPVSGPRSLLRGVPQSQMKGYPSPRSRVPTGQDGGGTPSPPGQDGVPSSQDRMRYIPTRTGWGTSLPTRTGWGTLQPGQDAVPPSQDRMRYLPARTGWGYPPPPPQNRLGLDWLRCGRYSSCGFSQEDCLVMKELDGTTLHILKIVLNHNISLLEK